MIPVDFNGRRHDNLTARIWRFVPDEIGLILHADSMRQKPVQKTLWTVGQGKCIFLRPSLYDQRAWEAVSMSVNRAQILCVGDEVNLLRLRCAVLDQQGYRSQAATVKEAIDLLRTLAFDLVILSAGLSDDDRNRLLFAAGKTSTLGLRGLIFPQDLIREVEKRLTSLQRKAK
jgi:hypothetical protein